MALHQRQVIRTSRTPVVTRTAEPKVQHRHIPEQIAESPSPIMGISPQQGIKPDTLLQLQRTHGNQFVQRLVAPTPLRSAPTPTPSPRQQVNQPAAHQESPSIQREDNAESSGESGGILGQIRNRLAEGVRTIPGYMLICYIIGRDIVANTAVQRNATNLVGAIMGLMPGGAGMFENLQRSGALQRAFDWFSAELTKLNFTWGYISGLFRGFASSLSFSDVFNPMGVITRLRDTFAEPARRLRDFAVSAVMKVAEFIFEGVMGAGGTQILNLIKRSRDVFNLIISDPVRFIGNLIRAVRGGFDQFKNNIGRHLQAGLIGWLTGSLAGTGITIPRQFDLRGILTLVLQILGLTYHQLRPRFVRLLGEPRVRLLEGAFEFLRILVTEGLPGVWRKITEFVGNLVDMVIGGIRQFVIETIVQQAIVRLVTLFNPVGAVVQAIITIYNTIQWFIQRIQQIMALVNAVVDSLDNIARGNLSAAINYVEQTMARALPVIISFLAGFLGLNRIADKVREIIERIRAVVNRALDRVINFVVERVRSFTGAGGDQNSQEKLNRGLDAGVAAVNRLSGSRIGAAVMQPVLAAIRIRYGLRVLEPVVKDGKWWVRGVVNPDEEKATNKEGLGVDQAHQMAKQELVDRGLNRTGDGDLLVGTGFYIVGHGGHNYAAKKRIITEIGRKYGCHTNKDKLNGGKDFTPDHQMPNSVFLAGGEGEIRFYPHSQASYQAQSGAVSAYNAAMKRLLDRKNDSKWAKGVKSEWFHGQSQLYESQSTE